MGEHWNAGIAVTADIAENGAPTTPSSPTAVRWNALGLGGSACVLTGERG
jgi:hypothetical protein